MPSTELSSVLCAPELAALGAAGADALSPLGDFRLQIDEEVVLTRGNGLLSSHVPIPTLPGSAARLSSERPASPMAVMVASVVANTHIRLLLQGHLEARVLLNERHLHAVDRTVGFLGELDEHKVRVGILSACMDVVDAPVGAMLERGTSGWWVSVDMGLPGPALVPHLELHDGESFRISTLENGLRVVLVPLGASEGTPVMVVLTDWGLDDEQLAPLLSTVSRLGRVALDNAHLVRVAGERQRLRIELELAGRTQEQLMPTEAPRWPGLEVVGHSRPSADCGGDYFDWFDLPGRGFVTCVADVSGHGVGAAIVMATLRGYLNASLRHNEPLDETLASITTMLCSILEPWQFVTVFLAEIDEDGKTLRFCNAGHEAALLIRSKGSVERLEADAPPLGIDPLLTPRVETVVLQPDDMLVIPTDGLAEAEDPQGVQIGRDQFEEWVVRCVRESHSAVAARDRILAEVANYRDHSEQMDDETLLVLRRRGETR